MTGNNLGNGSAPVGVANTSTGVGEITSIQGNADTGSMTIVNLFELSPM
jgi:hypothetical protein